MHDEDSWRFHIVIRQRMDVENPLIRKDNDKRARSIRPQLRWCLNEHRQTDCYLVLFSYRWLGGGWDWASQTIATGPSVARRIVSNFDLGGRRGGTLPTGSVCFHSLTPIIFFNYLNVGTGIPWASHKRASLIDDFIRTISDLLRGGRRGGTLVIGSNFYITL